ncbi:hypothetical protein FQA47_008152 [Oryzias melastigma]|uniref:Uncharacterized protein n=1 Tax=Oryzias melastigma TaxID=30732 RepID=A0A834CA16_ORYME|nr:hypothetical protein FQA47_008152 [Oryzias melastigma]
MRNVSERNQEIHGSSMKFDRPLEKAGKGLSLHMQILNTDSTPPEYTNTLQPLLSPCGRHILLLGKSCQAGLVLSSHSPGSAVLSSGTQADIEGVEPL